MLTPTAGNWNSGRKKYTPKEDFWFAVKFLSVVALVIAALWLLNGIGS